MYLPYRSQDCREITELNLMYSLSIRCLIVLQKDIIAIPQTRKREREKGEEKEKERKKKRKEKKKRKRRKKEEENGDDVDGVGRR